jgi:hypothetical protein
MLGRAAYALVLLAGVVALAAGFVLLIAAPVKPTHLSTYACLAAFSLLLGVGNRLANPPTLLNAVLALAFGSWFFGAGFKTIFLMKTSFPNRLSRIVRRWTWRTTRFIVRSTPSTDGAGLSGPARRRLRRGRLVHHVGLWVPGGASSLRSWAKGMVSTLPSLIMILPLTLAMTLALAAVVSIGDDAANRVARGRPPFGADSALGIVFHFPVTRVQLIWVGGKAPSGISTRLMYLGEANGMLALYDVDAGRVLRIPAGLVVVKASDSDDD